MDQPGKHHEHPDSPPPNPARRIFCGSIGALALAVSACGGSDDSPPPPPPAPAPPPPAPAPPPPAALSCGAIAISANHGHTLTIAAADVDSTVSRMYSIAGVAGHDHTIVLTPVQLAQIKGKTSVTVNSSVDLGHFHGVTVNCA